MKTVQKIITVSLFCVSYITLAQQIQTDRPNETEGPNAIAKHHLQVESGFSFEKDNDEKTFEIPEIVLRYGLLKNLEFRIESALKITNEESNNDFGIEPVTVGFKYHILDHKYAIPDLSLIHI